VPVGKLTYTTQRLPRVLSSFLSHPSFLTMPSKPELLTALKALGVKGYSGKNKPELEAMLAAAAPVPVLIPAEEVEAPAGVAPAPAKKRRAKAPAVGGAGVAPAVAEDPYTEAILRENYTVHRDYHKVRKATRDRTGLDIRLANIPEDISENIVKFIIRNKLGDATCRWTKSVKKLAGHEDATSGDLYSHREKKQECKCFTSDGPASFGPNEPWDVIYFLDMRKWMDDEFTLFRIPLKNTDAQWQSLVMDGRKETKITFGDQCKQGKRPHKCWEGIRAQLPAELVETVYTGTFEGIFAPAPAGSA
jgi:hypothetical protein